ncbi:MAG: SufD family Fe-S cluster assembly protein [Treponema sp.]|nr:SufD family Fe-S cluster assembly protein [Treponema sp.]
MKDSEITDTLLQAVANWKGKFSGAHNVRVNCKSVSRASTENVEIVSLPENKGLKIVVKANTKNEIVSIPACITHENVDDLVYNDFYIGENADVTIIAGCGIHTENEEPARHSGIHRFFLEKNSRVIYEEKHIGIGAKFGKRTIDPITEFELSEGAHLEMHTSQIGGVDKSDRKTEGTLATNATLIIKENILTEGDQTASTAFKVELNGDDSSVSLISRSVAKGNSRQTYYSNIIGNARCYGHSECDAILADKGIVSAAPELTAACQDAQLIHEAAIGKIAGEQILKLRTLGLTEEEAEQKIIEGFLK